MSYAVIEFEETPVHSSADTSATPYRISTVKHFIPLQGASLTEGVSHLDRSDEQRNIYAAPAKLVDGFAPGGSMRFRATPNLWVPMFMLAGFDATFQAGAGTNKVMNLTSGGTVSGGTFTLTFSGQTTVPLAWNATATVVQAALEALSNVEPGEILVGGGPWPATPLTFTFRGRYAASSAPVITGSFASLTGSSPTGTIGTPTAGAAGAVLDPDGQGVPTGATLVTLSKRQNRTAKSARVTLMYTEDGVYQRGSGMGVSSLSMNANGEMSVEFIGLWAEALASAPTYTPTYDALTILPMRRGDIELSWGPSGSAIAMDFDFALANPIERGDHLGIKGYAPKLLEATTGQPMVTGNVSRRYIDRDDLEALNSAVQFSGVASWTTPSYVGSSGAYYTGWLLAPGAQMTSGAADEMTNSRRFGGSYGWEANYSEAAGYDVRFACVCGLPNLAAVESFA